MYDLESTERKGQVYQEAETFILCILQRKPNAPALAGCA
jgi:hypothetical protein